MPLPNLTDLGAFAAVAQARSCTRATLKLGVSPSALSQTITNLERRLGLWTLLRTTRSVAPTEVGTRLVGTLTRMLLSREIELDQRVSRTALPALEA